MHVLCESSRREKEKGQDRTRPPRSSLHSLLPRQRQRVLYLVPAREHNHKITATCCAQFLEGMRGGPCNPINHGTTSTPALVEYPIHPNTHLLASSEPQVHAQLVARLLQVEVDVLKALDQLSAGAGDRHDARLHVEGDALGDGHIARG